MGLKQQIDQEEGYDFGNLETDDTMGIVSTIREFQIILPSTFPTWQPLWYLG